MVCCFKVLFVRIFNIPVASQEAPVLDPREQHVMDNLNAWLAKGGHLTKQQARDTCMLLQVRR